MYGPVLRNANAEFPSRPIVSQNSDLTIELKSDMKSITENFPRGNSYKALPSVARTVKIRAENFLMYDGDL